MKLLIVTQEVDNESNTLGFFHEWISELAPNYESVEVICLKEGKHNLPGNVHVHSLGKEKKNESPLVYAVRFKLLAWKLRNSYDRVFVHMNQEYVLLAGPIWMLLGKKVYLWRNHYAGSFLTDLAALFCTKIFCTSKRSYTAKFGKTILMPVGVDTQRFLNHSSTTRIPGSILFFARIAPSKRPEMLIEALGLLKQKGIHCIASIYGSSTESDVSYYEGLKVRVQELGLQDSVTFSPGVPNSDTPSIYAAHEINVNCSPSGMFDKMLFEAAASGCLVLAISEDFSIATSPKLRFTSAEELSERIQYLLDITTAEETGLRSALHTAVAENSLSKLISRFSEECG